MKNPTHSIIPFDHEVFGTIRSVSLQGSPWFVAADVCKALEYKNTTAAIKTHVPSDCKSNFSLGLPGTAPTLINEEGLYSLIIGSHRPAAKEFKRWVLGTVLPAIRRDGAYIRGEERLLEEASLEELQARIAALQAQAARAVEVKVIRAGLCHAEEREARFIALRELGRSRGRRTTRKA